VSVAVVVEAAQGCPLAGTEDPAIGRVSHPELVGRPAPVATRVVTTPDRTNYRTDPGKDLTEQVLPYGSV
jgi:hypothetical protein